MFIHTRCVQMYKHCHSIINISNAVDCECVALCFCCCCCCVNSKQKYKSYHQWLSQHFIDMICNIFVVVVFDHCNQRLFIMGISVLIVPIKCFSLWFLQLNHKCIISAHPIRMRKKFTQNLLSTSWFLFVYLALLLINSYWCEMLVPIKQLRLHRIGNEQSHSSLYEFQQRKQNSVQKGVNVCFLFGNVFLLPQHCFL